MMQQLLLLQLLLKEHGLLGLRSASSDLGHANRIVTLPFQEDERTRNTKNTSRNYKRSKKPSNGN
jgi:hypothetical protein